MTKYILKRLISIIPVLLGITIFAFIIGVVSPGDPAYLALTRDGVTEPSDEDIIIKRHQLKLDLPIHQQYGYWLSQVTRGDFGKSMYTGESIADELKRRLPITLKLSVSAFILTVSVGISLGAVMTFFRGKWQDSVIKALTSIMMSIPSFWLGILLIILFAENLKWLPTSGVESWKSYVLPSIVLSMGAVGVSSRLARANFIAELSKHYVLVANAKGLKKWVIALVHIFKNAMMPLVTYFGLYFAALLGGTSVIESLFSMPGLGSYIIEAIFNRDYYILQAYVVVTGSIYVVVTILIDIGYFMIDPRLKSNEVDV